MSEKPYMCTVAGCQAGFFRPYRLQLHLKKHSGEKPFVCDEVNCNKAYFNQSHLRRHKNKAHLQNSNIEILYTCTEEGCEKKFASSNNLKRHYNTAHGPNKKQTYKCETCSKEFLKKNLLRFHVKEHEGGTPFKCELCPLSFPTYDLYRSHYKRHKTYTCPCGEVFHRWTDILKHKRIFHRLNRYTCPTCQRKFTWEKDYKTHLTVHEENREVFECPYEKCGRLYYYKKNLQHHVQVYHMKVKKHKRKKPKPRTEKSKVGSKTTRKDKGTMKKSTALRITCLEVPYEAEKAVLSGQQISAENSDLLIDSSDFSDVEVHLDIRKIKQMALNNVQSEAINNEKARVV